MWHMAAMGEGRLRCAQLRSVSDQQFPYNAKAEAGGNTVIRDSKVHSFSTRSNFLHSSSSVKKKMPFSSICSSAISTSGRWGRLKPYLLAAAVLGFLVQFIVFIWSIVFVSNSSAESEISRGYFDFVP
jgi:hypothetical protein